MSSARIPRLGGGRFRPARDSHRARGLSLFEVILALVVFACGMAGLMHCLAVAERAGVNAQFMNAAIVRAKSIHSMLDMESNSTPGIVGRSPRTSGTFEDDRRWSWRVDESPAELPVARKRTVTVYRQGTTESSS